MLPSGDTSSSNSSNLLIILYVYDAFQAETSINQSITVILTDSINVTDILASNLLAASASFDVDLTLQTVNNVASVFNSGKCISAPNCVELNRLNCTQASKGMCGDCVDGFDGVHGYGTTLCYSSSFVHTRRRLSSIESCSTDADCPFFLCTSNSTCATPSKQCSSNSSSSICSGSGVCGYWDSGGKALHNCYINNEYCVAACYCSQGYGGSDCSLDAYALNERAVSRGTNLLICLFHNVYLLLYLTLFIGIMCSALSEAFRIQDPSFLLIQTLSNSLHEVFDPKEITNFTQIVTCLDVLTNVTYLSSQGYFSKANDATIQSIASILSKFADSIASLTKEINLNILYNITNIVPNNHNNSIISIRNNSIAFMVGKVVSDSVAGFTEGLLSSMIMGQKPLQIVSENIRLSIHNEYPVDLYNRTLSPPPSNNLFTQHTSNFGISLPTNGFDSCGLPKGDSVKLSVGAWTQNPYDNNGSDVSSPFLRFASSNAGSVGSAVQRARANFTLVIPFNTEQNISLTSTSAENRTIPVCTVRRGNGYRPCYCNVSAVTTAAVTFLCFDSRYLCPPPVKTSIVMAEQAKLFGLQAARDTDFAGDDYTTLFKEAFTDPSKQAAQMNVAEYGALLESIVGVVGSTLSRNPFLIDPKEAIPVLTLVSAILFFLVVGSVYFAIVDRRERLALVEAKMAGVSRRRTSLPEAEINRRKLSLAFYGGGISEVNKNTTDVKLSAIPNKISKSIEESNFEINEQEEFDTKDESKQSHYSHLASSVSAKASVAKRTLKNMSSKIVSDKSILEGGRWLFRFAQGVIGSHTLFSSFGQHSLAMNRYIYIHAVFIYYTNDCIIMFFITIFNSHIIFY